MANKRILGIAIVTGALWLPAGPASLATPASHGASVIPNAAHSIDVLDEVAARGGGGGGGRGGGARGGGPRGGSGMIGGGAGGMAGQSFAKSGAGMAGMAAGMTGGAGKQVAGKGAKGKQAAGKGGMGKQTAGKGGKGKQVAGKGKQGGGKAGGMGKDIAKKGGGAGGTVGVGSGNRPIRPWIQRPYYGTIIGGVALGSLLAATAYGVIPDAPADGLCWFWADDNLVQGYWDYC